MVRFEAPYPGGEKKRNSQWYHAAPRDIRSPDHLWKEYWQRFNTFRIPIFDEEEYFSTAVMIAKDSKNKKDFERKFDEINNKRFRELNILLGSMHKDISDNFPSRIPRMATSDARAFTCIEHFVRLLAGYILDRKADAEAAKIVVEKQDYTEENPLQEGGEIFVEDETETLIGEDSQKPPVNPKYEQYLATGLYPSDDEDGWDSQLPFNIDEGYKWNEEINGAYTKQFESWKPASDDNTLNSDGDVPSVQQVPSLTSSDTQGFEEANETAATKDGLRRRSSISSKSSSPNSAKKRVRFSDEDEDEDVSIHEPKRQKMENPLAPTPISPAADVPSPIKQVAGASASRKRSRPIEEEEEDNGYKRQRTENVPRPPSPTSPASSTEDESAFHLAHETLEKAPKERASNNGRRKQRIQKSTPKPSRAKSPGNTLNTRPLRRAKPSLFWGLLGKVTFGLVRLEREDED
ncbi:hypothetical protein V8C35DRAFT_288896 [Trichoderma chlorosporum]